ncbi:MAG TPA: HAMP domain-containing sensor histidine kinase [Polyangiaceae bacterium]
MHRPRTLRSRLTWWFFGAIVLAILAGTLAVMGTRPEPVTGAELMARNVGARLAATWDEPEATRAYVGEVRDVTGFEVKLVRDPRRLGPRVHMAAHRGAAIVPENPQHIFIPVERGGELVGALEMEKFGPHPMTWRTWPWWRLVVALGVVLAVMSVMAGRVANLLARPLEQLAHASDRFGGGDLAFRADVGRRHRWVALEVREVGVRFNRMADRVEAMVRGQRELLGAISHELRSPLGRARVALEIARDRIPPEIPPARSPASALDDVERQLVAVDSILGDLLDVTRAGLADLRKETRPLLEWLRARAAEEPAPPPVWVFAPPDMQAFALPFDGALLGRVVHNLLVNARAHGHPQGQAVEVNLSRTPKGVRVVVRDRGAGFPAGFVERAFEPFVRGDSARVRPTAGAGYGLGLAIVKRIVEAHGGVVFARNAADGGAEVGFDLPLAPSSPLD